MAVLSPTYPSKSLATRTSPLARWHLVSLDAPTVAALWTWFIASTNHIHLPAVSLIAMFFAVWMLYAGDRLLDSRLLETTPAKPHSEDLEARHYFHLHHRSAFLTGIVLASIALAILLPRIEATAIHLYLILGGLLAGYFIVIHAAPRAAASHKLARRLPKEIAVGIFFAAATFIPTVARRPDLRLTLIPSAILFATLCSLNCLFIYSWEHPAPTDVHSVTACAIRHLPILTALLILAAIALHILVPTQSSYSAACAAAVLILFTLDRTKARFSRLTLRASADAALLTPLLFLLIPKR